jgi:hypothetical protein
MITKKIIEKNKDFLDKVAMRTMVSYLHRSSLSGFKDSLSVSRISYKQALAMLEIRENSLESLAKESGILKKDKDGD